MEETMKSNVFFIAVSIVMILAGCTQEDDWGSNNAISGNYTLNAIIENDDRTLTRTTVNENGQVLWTENDCIGVFGNKGTKNASFALAKGFGEMSGSFKGNLSVDEEAETAYYPYAEDAALNGNTLTFTLPTEYTYTGNSNAPMLGVKNENGDFQFKHLAGLLKIMLKDIPEGASEFLIMSEGDNPLPLSGEVLLNDVTSENPTLQIKEQGNYIVVYHLPDAISEDELIFYVPIPVGFYPQLVVALINNEGKEFFHKTISNQNVRRATMIEFPVLNGYTGDCYVLSSTTQLITEDLAPKVSLSEVNENILVYKDVQEVDVPKVDDIVISRSTENLPYGFLGKVLDVTRNGDGSYSVTTGSAALSEAFDELYVNETFELVPEEITAPQSKALLDHIFWDKDFNMTLGLTYQDSISPSYANGEISLGAKLTVNMDFNKKEQLEYGAFTLEFTLRPSFDLGLRFSTEGEEKLEEIVKNKMFEIRFPRIPLAYGLIQIYPKLTPYFVVDLSGSASLYTGFETELKCVLVALYKDGVWQKTIDDGKTSANYESPWNIKSGFSLNGSAFVGLSNVIDLKLYNRDNAKIYFKPKVGCDITGKLNLEMSSDVNSLEETLTNSKAGVSLSFAGSLGADASVLSPKALQAEIEIIKFSFWEKELELVPTFKKLTAQVSKMIDEQAGTRAADDTYYKAEVNTEASGELMMKDMQIGLALVDHNDEIIEMTPLMNYGGGGKTYATDPDMVLALRNEFLNLQKNSFYEVYPIVSSPVFERIATDRIVLLKNQAVDINTMDDERKILIDFYKSTGGDNWDNNTNWCSNAPLRDWYGVRTNEDDKVISIELDNNNLINDANLLGLNKLEFLDLSDNALTSLHVPTDTLMILNCQDNNIKNLDVAKAVHLKELWCGMNQLTGLDVSGLNELTALSCYNNLLTSLDISGCINLRKLECSGGDLPDLDVSHCTQLEDLDVTDCELTELNVSRLNNLIELHCGGNNLSVLNVSNLVNLESLDCSGNQLRTLDVANLKKLKELDCEANELTSLDVSGLGVLEELECTKNQLVSLNLSETKNLIELDCSENQLSTLDVSDLINLDRLDCSENKLTSLDVSNSVSMTILFCTKNQLIELNVSGLEKLENLQCQYNQLETLDVSTLKSMRILTCVTNQLISLDVSNLENLEELRCTNNQLTNLNLSNLGNLVELHCSDNQLTNLDVSDSPLLTLLACDRNPLVVLDISGIENLITFRIDGWGDTIQKIYLSAHQEGFKSLFHAWGERNYDLYLEPNHLYGYQYPEFIYK